MMESMHTSPQAPMTRRGFLAFAGAAGLCLLPAGGLMAGCSADQVTETLDTLGVKSTLDASLRHTRQITDHAGRTREIPTADALERVYFTGALAQIFVFTLAPELQAGSGMQFTPEELQYLPAGTADLLYMGTLSGGGEIDREMLLKTDVQLIVDCSGRPLTPADISTAQKLEDQTGIPTLCIDGSFDKIVEAYRLLGEILGRTERAADIGTYLADVYDRVTAAVSSIPEEERVRLYYAEGPLGLQTEPDEGLHALCFSVAGANNVAAVEESQGIGMTNVSLEAVLAWNPQVIVAWDDVIRGGADEVIRHNPDWASIDAVANGRVYTMPNAPYAWCDRPPGVNRFLGIQWVANMCYPDAYDVDMLDVVKDFYSRLYWVDITDDQAKDLLGNSYPPYRG